MSETPNPHPHPTVGLMCVPQSLRHNLAQAHNRANETFLAQFAAGGAGPHAYVESLNLRRRFIEGACWPVPGKQAAPPPALPVPPPPAAHRPTTTLTIPDDLPNRQALWTRDARVAPMCEIARRLAKGLPTIARPAVFGSLASDDAWPGYSDVDLLLFLSEMPTDADINRISKAWHDIMPLILRIDPVQHHGPYVFFPDDERLFFPSLLPAAALQRATMLDGSPLTLDIQPVDDRVLSIKSLLDTYAGFKGMAGRWRVRADRYSAKMTGSLALLGPALVAGALGKPMEKGASFDWFKSSADAATREAVEEIERWRRAWDDALPLPESLLRAAGSRAPWLSRQFNRIPSIALEARTRDMIAAAEKVFLAALARVAAEPET